MKYKIGDKIEIKEEYLSTPRNIFEKYYKRMGGFLTITEIIENRYMIGTEGWNISPEAIKCLYKEPEPEPILSRFELLDL